MSPELLSLARQDLNTIDLVQYMHHTRLDDSIITELKIVVSYWRLHNAQAVRAVLLSV
jgi:hypothetical protein